MIELTARQLAKESDAPLEEGNCGCYCGHTLYSSTYTTGYNLGSTCACTCLPLAGKVMNQTGNEMP